MHTHFCTSLYLSPRNARGVDIQVGACRALVHRQRRLEPAELELAYCGRSRQSDGALACQKFRV